MNVQRQAHPALYAHFPESGGLEAKLDQPRRHERRHRRWLVIARQVFRHLADHPFSIPPRPLQNLVRGTVEVDAIDVGGFDDGSRLRSWGALTVGASGGCSGQPHASREVSGHLRLWPDSEASGGRSIGNPPPRSSPAGENTAWMVTVARLVPIELERRQEIYLFDRLDMPAGKHDSEQLPQSLDAHDAGQHRRAVDLMIVQERLDAGSSVVSMVRPL